MQDPTKVYYGSNQQDVANIGFDDEFIYKETPLPYEERSIPFEQIGREIALEPFNKWAENKIKWNIKYALKPHFLCAFFVKK
jgi:hypothetical protein